MRNWLIAVVALALAPAVAPGAEEGVWTRLTPPSVLEGQTVFDPVRNRMILFPFGFQSAPNEAWTLDLAHPDRWIRRTMGADGPTNDRVRAAIYDPRLDRMLVLARDQHYSQYDDAPTVVWALSLAAPDRWRELAPLTTPPDDRMEFALVRDSRRGCFVMYGGGGRIEYPKRRDLWRFEAGPDDVRWEELPFTGDSTAARSNAGAIYDARRDRMVLYGGSVLIERGGILSVSNDVVAFDFSPAPHATEHIGSREFYDSNTGASCAYDSVADRVIVFTEDSWHQPIRALALDDLTSWSVYDTTGTQGPPVRAYMAAADPERGRAILAGDPLLISQIPLAPAPPAAPRRIDPGDDRIPIPQALPADLYPREPSLLDPRDGTVRIWGGTIGTDDAWAHQLWRFAPNESPHWSVLDLPGTVPRVRWGAAFAYDLRRNRWLMFGGYAPRVDTTGAREVASELWALELGPPARWTLVSGAAASPHPRLNSSTSATYDAIHDQLIVFGSTQGPTETGSSELWSFPLGTPGGWRRLTPSGRAPHARVDASATWDPARDRVLIFGGDWIRTSSFEPVFRALGDTWAVGLGDSAHWDSLETNGGGRFTSEGHFAALDEVRGGMSVIGGAWRNPLLPPPPGATRYEVFHDLSLDDPPTWSGNYGEGALPVAGQLGVAFDTRRDRILAFNSRLLGNAFAYDRDQPVVLAPLDFEPNDPTNMIRPGAHGTVTVAVLGTPAFDAAQVDPASVTLEGAPARAPNAADRSSLRDVNGDGFPDRVLRFDGSRVAFDAARLIVRLAGRLRTDEALVGYDEVHVSGGLDRTPIATSGDPDVPTDTIAPLRLIAFGPAPGRARLGLSLPRASGVTLEIYSVAGRRVLARDLGILSAGGHELPIELGSELRVGVFFARVSVGTETLQTKFVILP